MLPRNASKDTDGSSGNWNNRNIRKSLKVARTPIKDIAQKRALIMTT